MGDREYQKMWLFLRKKNLKKERKLAYVMWPVSGRDCARGGSIVPLLPLNEQLAVLSEGLHGLTLPQ